MTSVKSGECCMRCMHDLQVLLQREKGQADPKRVAVLTVEIQPISVILCIGERLKCIELYLSCFYSEPLSGETSVRGAYGQFSMSIGKCQKFDQHAIVGCKKK